MLLMTIDAAH